MPLPAVAAIAAIAAIVTGPGFAPVAAQAGDARHGSRTASIDRNAYARALVCASTDAVLAGILEGGTPTQADLADAAVFRARAKDWLARAVAASPSGQDATLAEFDREALRLGQSVNGAKDADSAQVLLDSRLLGCDLAGASPRDSPPAASISGASPV
ncbi:hypothetical protein [Novosphingobium sp.]|uniref:hypothetical protein n=1 Tax=Novosphingobium sp. TaxID=1874826 RepID=UPI0038BCAD29